MNLLFATQVWGPEYVRMFTDVALPAILHPSNIPAIDRDINKKYMIMTTERDRLVIEKSPWFKKLSDYCSVRTLIITPGGAEETTTDAFKFLAMEARNLDAHFKMVAPDGVPAAGAYKRAVDILKTGKSGIVIPIGAFRVNRDAFCRDVLQIFLEDSGLNIPGSQLFHYALKHLHHETRSHFVDSSTFHPFPAQIIFQENSPVIVHSFLCQPWFIKWESDRAVDFFHPEYDYAWKAAQDPADIHIVASPGEIFEAYPTPIYGREILWPQARYSAQKVAGYMGQRLFHPQMVEVFKHGFPALKDQAIDAEVQKVCKFIRGA